MTGHIATPTVPVSQPLAWTRLAACRRRWADLDWIDPTPAQARRCRAICGSCLVQRACLSYALVAAEPWGIWGGLDADQRAALARLVGLPVPTVLPPHGFRARYAKHGCRCRACRHAHAVYEHHRRHRSPAA
jgi:hypothetical protein